MIRLTRDYILRVYKGRMHELTTTVSGSNRGWSIFMRPPAKNDDIPLATPFSKYSKFSHLAILTKTEQPVYCSLLGNMDTWMDAKAHEFTLANMRSLVSRGFLEFKRPLPKVRVWEGNWGDWEIAVMSTPFRLSEYGALVIRAWSWYEWMWTPDLPKGEKVEFPHSFNQATR